MLGDDLQEPPSAASKLNLTLTDLDLVRQRTEALPPGITVKKLKNGEYADQAPGMAQPIRITTRLDYFDEHSASLEFWSAGSPAFPATENESSPEKYRLEFPGAEIMFETVRAARMRAKSALPHWEPLWSWEYVLDRTWEFHRRGWPA